MTQFNYRPGRIFLSVPHMGGHERNYVQKALEDNWVTTAGPNIPGFEHDVCQHTNAQHAVAVSSGTAAIHLALRVMGVKPGDEVICPTFTFVASANPILYLGATPVFVDSEPETWNLNPELLEEAIKEGIARGKKPACIIVVHLYGMPANMKAIMAIADQYEIPVLEDAAEALGSRFSGHQVGTFGKAGIFSFSGNKIITTSGGGVIITAEEELAKQAAFLANQAKDEAPYYLHSQMGYNYTLSNINAGIGRGQMEMLEKRVKQRREIYTYYYNKLSDIEELYFLPEPKTSFSNRWLTTILLPKPFDPEQVRQELENENIEARRLWKPMHQQPLFAQNKFYGNGTSDKLFERGLCLPSSSLLTEEDLDKVVKTLRQALEV